MRRSVAARWRAAAPDELAGGASGVFSTARQFGGALGAAAIGTAWFADLSPGAAMRWVLAAYGAAACSACGSRWAAAAEARPCPRGGRRSPRGFGGRRASPRHRRHGPRQAAAVPRGLPVTPSYTGSARSRARS
ncbi:hypothetical protein [Streptomyces flavochromogenes]|uniref:hypothetical protein n=1 Tax=Streptomyces flavochromogenes TaxID=68199 RepID=UPI00099B4E8F|nr:hypothetical protein [Streptomyces flavochromogenes]